MRERRFLVDAADIGDGRARIRGDELHHLARVLRLRAGDEVSVFDGRGAGFEGRIDTVGRTEAAVILERPEDPAVEPADLVTLFQAALHGDRMDWIVEKATEIGAFRFVPVLSARGVVRPRERGWGRLERWRRIAVSAAKQSGRLVVPEVCEPVPFDEAIRWGDPAARPPERALAGGSDARATGRGEQEGFRSHEPPAGRILQAAAARLLFHPSGGAPLTPASPPDASRSSRGSTFVLIGPEGGWSEEEVSLAAGAGWTTVSLGSRILRAETAAVVALGLLLAGR